MIPTDHNRITPYFLFIVICFTIFYLIFSMQIAMHFFRGKDFYIYDRQKFLDQEIFDLKVKKQFWTNKIITAKEDSIIISLNLQDSTLTMDLEGIELRRCRIYQYELNNRLARKKREGTLLSLTTAPFILEREKATIPKQPVILHEVEVGSPVLADLSFLNRSFDSTNVILDFTFTKDLHIRFEERHFIWPEIYPTILPPDRIYLVQYSYYIVIQMDARDLRALYRALPMDAMMILCP